MSPILGKGSRNLLFFYVSPGHGLDPWRCTGNGDIFHNWWISVVCLWTCGSGCNPVQAGSPRILQVTHFPPQPYSPQTSVQHLQGQLHLPFLLTKTLLCLAVHSLALLGAFGLLLSPTRHWTSVMAEEAVTAKSEFVTRKRVEIVAIWVRFPPPKMLREVARKKGGGPFKGDSLTLPCSARNRFARHSLKILGCFFKAFLFSHLSWPDLYGCCF